MILDSGERTVHANGFQRDMHEGKGRMDLLPWRAIMEVSKHCEEGAKKYGERNIDKGCPQHSLIDSAFRHLAKYTVGMTDEDHLRACAWNILWALEQEVCRPDMQDIPARMAHTPEPDLDINIRQMNEELNELSEKHPGPGYQSGIRRGIRESREIFDKYFVSIHTPCHGGWEKIGEEEEVETVTVTRLDDGVEIEVPVKKTPVEWVLPERPAFDKLSEWVAMNSREASKYNHAVSEPHHSINPERRCVEMTCYYNTAGFCQSVTDLWNPDLGEQCPDFSED